MQNISNSAHHELRAAQPEKDGLTRVLGWKDRDAAREIIRSSHQRYMESSAS
jgi:inorganic pyrophosphatase